MGVSNMLVLVLEESSPCQWERQPLRCCHPSPAGMDVSLVKYEFLNTGQLVRAWPRRSQPSDDCFGGLGEVSP